jgi:hypothetical protein
MKEKKCEYKILAWIDGEKKEIVCDPSMGCLYELVWSGIGVKSAAAQVLDIEAEKVEKACVSGNCVNPAGLEPATSSM